MNLTDQIVEALAENKKAMHVNDIAAAIVKRYPNTTITVDVLSNKVSSVLASSIKNKKQKSPFSKPKNNKGGKKRGMYRLKMSRSNVSKSFKVPEQPKVTTQYTGKAGEFSVLSELLFFGFNASSMTVDDGIDVVASRDGSYFHIQVKTSNISTNGRYRFTITQKSFDAKDSSSTFYILVMRNFEGNRYVTDHLIIPNSEVRRLVERSVIRQGKHMSIAIEKARGGKFILNNIEDITWSLNRYDIIK